MLTQPFLEQIRDLIVKEGGGHIVEIVGLDAEHADGTKLPEKKKKKKKEEPRLTPKGTDQIWHFDTWGNIQDLRNWHVSISDRH